VRISATMEFAMKGMFLSCPDASKARRTFMNPSDAASILRIGHGSHLLILGSPSIADTELVYWGPTLITT
jgi:hypothetical protein